MKLISIPLTKQPDGRVIYLGDFSQWSQATAVGTLLVGYYSGPLYEADGTTKAFNWSDASALRDDFAQARWYS